MVTLEEIRRREEELNRIESSAQQISSQEIPQRRFGSRVTKQIQQDFIQKRDEAREAIRKVQEERTELQRLRDEEEKRNVTRAALEKIKRQAEGKNRGRFKSEEEKNEYLRLLKENSQLRRAIEVANAKATGQLKLLYTDKQLKKIEEAGYDVKFVGYTPQFQSKDIVFLNDQGYSVADIKQEEFSKQIASGSILGFSGAGTSQQLAKKELYEKVGFTPKTEIQTEYYLATNETGKKFIEQNKQQIKDLNKEVIAQQIYASTPYDVERVAREQRPVAIKVLEKGAEYTIKKTEKLQPFFQYQITPKYNVGQILSAPSRGVRKLAEKAADFPVKPLAFTLPYKIVGGNKQKEKEMTALAYETGFYFIPGAALPLLASGTASGLERASNKDLTTLERTGGLVEAGANIVPLTIVSGAKANKFLNEEIVLRRELPKDLKISFKELQVIKQLEGAEPEVLAQFSIQAYKPPRFQYTIKRGDKLLEDLKLLKPTSEFNKKAIKDLSFEELTLKYPKGQIKLYEEPAFIISAPEIFKVKNGIISESVRGTKGVGVATIKATPSKSSKPTISILKGGLKPGKELRLLDRTKLSKNEEKALELAETLINGKKAKVTKQFVKETTFDTGGVILTDVLKSEGRGIFKTVKPGKRISRAELVALQESKGNIEYNREFGLISEELLKSRIGAIDTTFPRFVKPKKGFLIKGQTLRQEYYLPAEPEPTKMILTKRKDRTPEEQAQLLKQLYETSSATQKAVGTIATKVARSLKTSRTTYPITSQKTTTDLSSVSLYAGTGLYETTGETLVNAPEVKKAGNLFIGNINIQRTEPRQEYKFKTLEFEKIEQPTKVKEFEREVELSLGRNINKELSRNINKEIAREIAKETTRLIPREITKQNTKQTTKQTTRQLLKQTVKTPVPPKTPRPPFTPIKTKLPKIPTPSFSPEKMGKSFTKGFKAFIFRKGQKQYVGGIVSRGKALRLGELEAKQTLAATFGIEESGTAIEDSDNYLPNEKIFRSYRIKGKSKIPLKNLFIQRTRKEGGLSGGRLAFRTEVLGIQRARGVY